MLRDSVDIFIGSIVLKMGPCSLSEVRLDKGARVFQTELVDTENVEGKAGLLISDADVLGEAGIIYVATGESLLP
jgi:calcineurin-like phosphoesterase